MLNLSADLRFWVSVMGELASLAAGGWAFPREGAKKEIIMASFIDNLVPLIKMQKMNKLTKEYKFKNFVEAMSFVQKVAFIAEKLDHHPDITIKYNQVLIESYTHTTGTVTEKDHQLIALIEKSLE